MEVKLFQEIEFYGGDDKWHRGQVIGFYKDKTPRVETPKGSGHIISLSKEAKIRKPNPGGE